MPEQSPSPSPVTGLILSGGGARAAYQVGVLSAIAELLPETGQNPFPVIVGASAGAVNAVSLACGALQFGTAIQRLTAVWRGFHTGHIYRSDWSGVVRQAGRFVARHLLGFAGDRPVALLDNAPLGELLARELDFSGIAAAVRQRRLRAVAVTAFGYETGQAVTFYQGRATIDPWFRHRRVGVPTRLNVEHLLASAAIPMLFPPVKVHREYFGDGALRQFAPISPALHLGANRVLVIGVSGPRRNGDANAEVPRPTGGRPPSLAQIGGHMLNSTFVDSLESDLETLQRINLLSGLLSDTARTRLGVRPVEVLTIAPSQPLEQLAAHYRAELPRALRPFFYGPGATRSGGAVLLSYLLFEPGYCNALIELGYRDAMAQREVLGRFLAVEASQPSSQAVSRPSR